MTTQAAGPFAAVFWTEIASNTIFMAGFYGWAIAQIAKVFTYKIKKGTWNLSQLVASGGMPSSHSSLCMVRPLFSAAPFDTPWLLPRPLPCRRSKRRQREARLRPSPCVT